MTISTNLNKWEYNGTNDTGPFNTTTKFLRNSDLVVKQTVIATGVETLLILDTDYTVLGAGDATGSVTTTVAVPAADKITIERVVDLTQLVDLRGQTTFHPEVFEDALDEHTMGLQQLDERQGRGVRSPITDLTVVEVGTKQLIGVVDPTSAQHAATKAYVDSVVLNPDLALVTNIKVDPGADIALTKLGDTSLTDLLQQTKVDPGTTGGGQVRPTTLEGEIHNLRFKLHELGGATKTGATHWFDGLRWHGIKTLAWGATVNWDMAADGEAVEITLTGATAVLANPTNLVAGALVHVRVTQDATGARVLTFGAKYKFRFGPALDMNLNDVTVFTFFCDGTNLYAISGDKASSSSTASLATVKCPTGDLLEVTGTNDIDTINEAEDGRRLTLRWSNALPGDLTVAGNVVLHGAFRYSPDQNDTISLIYDGPNDTWYETGRSKRMEYIETAHVPAEDVVAATLNLGAHGFPEKPKKLELWVVCTVIEANWQVGDELLMNVGGMIGELSESFQIFEDAGSIFGGRGTANIRLMNKTTGGQFNMVGLGTSWDAFARAWWWAN